MRRGRLRHAEVPGDSHRIRFPPLLKVPDGRFPPEEYVGMAALAQHHGVPTCVLDWTRDSRMGAYFAAARACSHIFQQLDEARRDRSGTGDLESHFRQQQLVVYALNVECLQTLIHSHFDASNDWEWDPLVRMVTVPYTSNPNLRRQRGVFTLVQPQDANVWPPPPLDEALQAGYESFRKSDPEGADALPEHPLQRFTLSWREARRLLFFLGQQGVTAASVYEGRDAVFKAMEESSMMTTTIPGVSPGA